MNNDESPIVIILSYIIIVAVIFGITAVFNQFIYGDWTCSFKNCTVVKHVGGEE